MDRPDLHRIPVGRGVGWSAIFLAVTRLSTVATVPLLLTHLGVAIYGAWVLSGTIVMSQGLVDLGVGAAAVRFIAVGAAQNSRPAVLRVVRQAAWMYGGLSLIVGGLLWFGGGSIVDLIPALRGAQHAHAVTLIHYVAGAFGLTNVVTLLAAIVEGCGRVDASYRAQTLGWLLFIPALAGGLWAGRNVDAIGQAWILAYCAQIVLLTFAATAAVRKLSDGAGPSLSWLELVRMGGGWQVSSWADFATFQLPRLAVGVALPAPALVSIDLAMRFAQIAVAPLFAAFPVVVPVATRIHQRNGVAELARIVSRWQRLVIYMSVLGVAVLSPLSRPAIAIWTGRPMASVDVVVNLFVLIGVVAHATTGLLSGVSLAVGRVSTVVWYKTGQLMLAGALIPLAAFVGIRAVAGALCVALVGPAIWFNRRASRRLHVLPAIDWRTAATRALAESTVICASSPAIALIATSSEPVPVAFVACAGAAAAAITVCVRVFDLSVLRMREATAELGV